MFIYFVVYYFRSLAPQRKYLNTNYFSVWNRAYPAIRLTYFSRPSSLLLLLLSGMPVQAKH